MTRKGLFWTSERSKERSKEPTAKFLTVLNDKQYNSSHSNSTDQINILHAYWETFYGLKFHSYSEISYFFWEIWLIKPEFRNRGLISNPKNYKIFTFLLPYLLINFNLSFSLFRANSTFRAQLISWLCTINALLCTVFIIFNIRNWKIKFFVLLRDVCLDLS